MQYIQKRGGLATESSYPYCIPPLGNCFPCNTNKTYCPSGEYCNRTCSVQNYQLVAKVAGYENVSQNEDDIAAYLVKNGPLSICLNAMWLQFYHSGISDPMVSLFISIQILTCKSIVLQILTMLFCLLVLVLSKF